MLSTDSLAAGRPSYEPRRNTADEEMAAYLLARAKHLTQLLHVLERLPLSCHVNQAISDCGSLADALERIAAQMEDGE